MRALIVILLMAVCVHAQSLADVARKERERRVHLKPALVIKAEGSPATAGGPATERRKPEEEPVKPQPPAVDPIKEWNEQIQKLRAKIQALQLEETATELQIIELNNQIFAPSSIRRRRIRLWRISGKPGQGWPLWRRSWVKQHRLWKRYKFRVLS